MSGAASKRYAARTCQSDALSDPERWNVRPLGSPEVVGAAQGFLATEGRRWRLNPRARSARKD